MPKHHVLILGSKAGVAAARALASREDILVTLAVRTGETPYTRMLIKGVAFGPDTSGDDQASARRRGPL